MSYQMVRKTDVVQAIDPHGRKCCHHFVVGHTALSFSPNVYVNDIQVIRKSDKGLHSSCCGSNTFTWMSASPNVLVNNKPITRSGVDTTIHCGGGRGHALSGSPNVYVNKG